MNRSIKKDQLVDVVVMVLLYVCCLTLAVLVGMLVGKWLAYLLIGVVWLIFMTWVIKKALDS